MNPTLMKLTKNRRGASAAQAVLLIAITVVFAWFVAKPKLNQLIQVRADIRATQKQLDRVELEQKQLDKLVSDLQSSPDEVKALDEALPLSDRTSRANVLFSSMVQSSGMGLTVLSAEDTKKVISAGDKQLLANPFQLGRTLHTTTISASITGTMDQLQNLLKLIETNGRVLDVDSLQIIGGEPVTKFKITVKAYSYEKNSTAADVKSGDKTAGLGEEINKTK